MLSMLLIIASVVISCLETMEYFAETHSTQHQVIHIVEVICVVWFTAEILIRFIVCPSKRKFVRQIMNWLDFAAIIPFYIQLFLSNTDVNSIVALRLIRLIRVFRVFKLSRHSYSLQILGHTLKSSLSELFLLGFFLSIGVVVFSTLMFYAEQESKTKKFSSIPAGFWWAVVTMTTLGYGDIVPDTLPGKIVGTACAICGVLTIALPIPVIVSNFSLYYSHAKAKQKASQRKRPLVIGAANALKVIDPFVGQRATNLRLSGMSEHTSYMSPHSRDRAWPKIALDMVGSSIDSSEPPASPSRRRLSKLPDKLWQFDQTRNFDSNKKQYDTTKKSNENCTLENPEDNPRSDDCTEKYDDCTNIFPKLSGDKSPKIGNRMFVTSYVPDEPNQDSAKCFDISETKTCNGAYENEAIENGSENENPPRTVNLTSKFDAHSGSDEDSIPEYDKYNLTQYTLPRIKIICNSSASQMSGSNNEDEGSDKPYRQPLKKKTKRKLKRSHLAVEKATSAPALSATTQGFSGKNLPGRMGRRGSVFVVGFLGKKWQAKAAKSRNNRNKSKPDNIESPPKKTNLDLLQVSPSISSPRNTTNDESRGTSTTSFNTPNSSISSNSTVFRFSRNRRSSESSFFRRSSCPTLQTFNISSHNMDRQNGCTKNSEYEHPAEYCNSDQENNSLDKTRSSDTETSEDKLHGNQTEPDGENSDIHENHNQVDTNHCELNGTKQNDLKTKYDNDNTTHNKDDTNNLNYKLCGTQRHEGKQRWSDVGENVNLGKEKPEDDLECSEVNVESSDEGNALHSGQKWDNTKSKREKLNGKQCSLSSNQSDSSLKADLDGTVRRPSSPLIRQRAFQIRERTTLDDSDDEMEALEKKFDADYHGKGGKASEAESNKQFASDKATTRSSSITLMEIRKNQPSNTEFGEESGRRTFEKENTSQTEIEYTPSSNAHISSDRGNNAVKRSPENSKRVMIAADTPFESKLVEETDKTTNATVRDKLEIKPLIDSQVSRTDDRWNDNFDNSTHIDLVKENGNFSYAQFPNSNESESTKNLHGDENILKEGNPRNNNEVDVYVKMLPNNFVRHNYSGLKNDQLNTQKQATANGQKVESEIKDDVCRRANAISPADRDGSKNLCYDNKNDTDRTTTNNDSINNNVQNGEKNRLNDQALRIQNYYRNSTSRQKYETIDIPEKNPIFKSENLKEHGINNQSETSELTTLNEDILGHTSKPSNIYARNTPKRSHSLSSSISSLGSVYQSTPLENTMDSRMLRKVEAQDSGVYCSDYRSSIDSLSSFTERNADRGILKPISEVEHDCDSKDGMLYFQPFSSCYERSRSHVLEIRDETAV